MVDFTLLGNGNTDVSVALNEALASRVSDEVHLPKGVYFLDKNVTVPASKVLVFAVGAVIKPNLNVVLRINGSWSANENYQIFDLSLGGRIAGDFKIAELLPEWLGAKGDGVADDAKAFNDAMVLCDKKRKMKLGAKKYRVRSTIENNSRGIEGTARYMDGANDGTFIIFDPIDKETDLLPCLRIGQSGHNAEFKDFVIKGRVGYNSRGLATWVNKGYFDEQDYRMFAVGHAGIEVTGYNTPVFRNVQTSDIKVGLHMTSINGHITGYDCNFSGLIGAYVKNNSGDYFFQGGGITGAFCGLMIGTTLEANHYGGIGGTLFRVHLGFTPYAIYQVKDDLDHPYETLAGVGGLSMKLISTRFERCGEAAIKLLPKSSTDGLSISGFGLTFSPLDYTVHNGGWECALPDELLPRDQKQKYAAWFGKIGKNVELLGGDAGGIFKSKAPGALGTIYIDTLDGNPNFSGVDSIDNVVIRRKVPPYTMEYATPLEVGNKLRSKFLNPISAGTITQSPHELSSWQLLGKGDGKLSIIEDLSTLPTALTKEILDFTGSNVKVLKYTPDGINAQTVALKALNNLVSNPSGRNICYEYFVL